MDKYRHPKFKTISVPQPQFIYGQSVKGVVHSQVGDPDVEITGEIIGMQFVVSEDGEYVQSWEYQVEFNVSDGAPQYFEGWYDDEKLEMGFEFMRPIPSPVRVRTHDEMQRNLDVFPIVVVEFSSDIVGGVAIIPTRHQVFMQVENVTLVEAAHAAHRAFMYSIEFVQALRFIKNVTGYPKGTKPDDKTILLMATPPADNPR